MSSGRRQLVLDLPHRPALGRDDFLVAPCNAAAVEWIDNWPDWPGPVLALCGPGGSGKSHLAAVWQSRSEAHGIDPHAIPKVIESGELPAGHLVMEDMKCPVDEEALLHLYNMVSERGRTLLLTSAIPPARWPVKLPDLASRLRTIPVAEIGAPDDALLEALLVKMFADRQLRVGPDVIAFLLPRMERSFAHVRALVERLDGAALSQQRTITIPLARNVLSEEGTDLP
ncbi:MAG: DNA replication protein [Rhodospirillaceae bacterium]|jgi:chromosomal replication initiation ATPase DnaA|nr:DNA replication protein [Rhodospirillaceae bacterium]MBT5459274.1 DNA replication protein [Rhodospirillaceae bacterium]